MRRILAAIDTLEEDFDKIKHIRDVVRQLKTRVDEAAVRLDRSGGHGHSHGQGHGHGHGQTVGGRDSRRR